MPFCCSRRKNSKRRSAEENPKKLRQPTESLSFFLSSKPKINQNMQNNDANRTVSEERVLSERGYKFVHKLAEGGYAKVYLTEFNYKLRNNVPAPSIMLACKVINTENAPRKFITKFLPRELAILSKISHPHIIPIHSIFYRKQIYYIFMKCAERGDLLEYLLVNGAIEENQARFWVKQISLALQYLHILEIAHRDMKCENVLITNHNNVQLGDFGFARSVLDEENKPVLSETYCGSISYAPPEILKGEKGYNPKIADIWSFGVLIYIMVNKGNPFETKNIKTFYDNQMKRKWKFRSKYANIISKECKDLVTAMMEPDVESRLKIEEIISSQWITMDAKLKKLTKPEYNALSNAMTVARSRGVKSEKSFEAGRVRTSDLIRRISIKNSLTVFKEYSSAFDLQLISSEYTFDKRLSV